MSQPQSLCFNTQTQQVCLTVSPLTTSPIQVQGAVMSTANSLLQRINALKAKVAAGTATAQEQQELVLDINQFVMLQTPAQEAQSLTNSAFGIGSGIPSSTIGGVTPTAPYNFSNLINSNFS